jgi:ketosteroid isomerase-like protein
MRSLCKRQTGVGTAAATARWLLVAACCLGFIAKAVAQGLYKCVDRGVTVYSDAPCMSVTGATNSAPRDKLSQEQVLALVQALDKAVARMDWAAVAAYLADDAVIDVRIKSSRKPRRATVGKAQYHRLVTEMKDKISRYSSRREDVQVTVHGDALGAEVESKLTERWQDPGGAMMATSRERWLVESRGGKLRIAVLDIVTGEPQPQPSQ